MIIKFAILAHLEEQSAMAGEIGTVKCWGGQINALTGGFVDVRQVLHERLFRSRLLGDRLRERAAEGSDPSQGPADAPGQCPNATHRRTDGRDPQQREAGEAEAVKAAGRPKVKEEGVDIKVSTERQARRSASCTTYPRFSTSKHLKEDTLQCPPNSHHLQVLLLKK